ncbi:MAG: hypothetical protein JWQ49_4294 [Edaphobacter sp.]|nr:hypothetical protein [Edaphobacter sp.]
MTARSWISIRNSMLEGDRVLQSRIQPLQSAKAEGHIWY